MKSTHIVASGKGSSSSLLRRSFVEVSTLSTHLGIYESEDSDRSYLGSLLVASLEVVSDYIGQEIGEITREEYFPIFHNSLELSQLVYADELELSYYNTDNDLVPVDSSLFVVDITSNTSALNRKHGSLYPTDISDAMANPIVVSYASHGHCVDEQEVVKQAVYMTAVELYQNRGITSEKSVNKLPLSAERLLSGFRRLSY